MRIQFRFFLLGTIVFLLISGFAFSLAAGEKSTLSESIRRDVEQEALEDAMKAFRESDYRKAKIGFEMLSEIAHSPDIRREALFGLASVKLVLADSPAEYENAVSVWKKWCGEVNSPTRCGDPRMLTPFLLKLQSTTKGSSAGQAAVKGRVTRNAGVRGILLIKEKAMQVLRSKLDVADHEIQRLRQQLESLEEIHRKYEEKKQEAQP